MVMLTMSRKRVQYLLWKCRNETGFGQVVECLLDLVNSDLNISIQQPADL